MLDNRGAVGGTSQPIDIRDEQLKLVFKQLPVVFAANVVNPIVIAAVLATVVPIFHVAIWAGLLAALSALRYGALRRQVKQRARLPGKNGSSNRDVLHLAIGSGISGVIWGVGLVILMPDTLLYCLFIAFVLGGMAAGAVVTLSPLLPVAIAFLLPCILPLAVRLALEGTPVHWGMSALVLMFAIGLSLAAWQLNQWIAATLRLKVEKTRLADELSDVLEGLERTVEQRTADLRRAHDEAKRANQTKSRFLAAASHDLGQPFQAMRLFIDLLEKRLADTPHAQFIRSLNQAHRNGELMLAGLLDLSRLEAGSVAVRPEEFPIADLLDRLNSEFRPLAESRNLKLRVRESAVTVFSDPLLLHQVAANLMSNALRYTRTGGILLACRQRSGLLRVEVWDTGIGIPADRLDDIFVEFHRIDPQSGNTPGGAGLGLAIVRQTAQLLDHRIQVCSRVGHGSLFAILVPLAAVPVAGAVWPGMGSTPDQAAVNGRGAAVTDRRDSIAC